MALSLRWKLGRRQLHWVGAGLLLLQNSTLVKDPWRWPQSTSGVSSSTLRNLLVILLMVMVGRGLLLTPRLLLETQPKLIQSLFKFLRRHHQTYWIMKHSEWWLHSQRRKRLAVRYLHWQRLVGRCFVVGVVLSHVMDASSVEMPPPPPLPRLLPLPQIIPVPLPPPPLPPIPAPRTPSPQRCSPGERPTTRSHSTGDKSDFYGRKWFEDNYGVKISMVPIYSTNGYWVIPLVVSLHLDVRRGGLFLAWTTYSSSSLPIISDGWHCTPPNSW